MTFFGLLPSSATAAGGGAGVAVLRFSKRVATRFASACRIHAFAARSASSVPAVALAPLFLLLLSALAPPPPPLIGGRRLSSRGGFLTAVLDWTVVVVVSCAADGSLVTAFFQTCDRRDME
ncbi:unnamed protein product [Miscanthus lutarioriparius]|uniref:Uncharacterized protein n=1 Tax=Miscanthus lutarioriparius TaxID=422564 RepID=A0A811S430_9POAL|nr:unnamed protein product [Miscanthus lutarioriparius]